MLNWFVIESEFSPAVFELQAVAVVALKLGVVATHVKLNWGIYGKRAERFEPYV